MNYAQTFEEFSKGLGPTDLALYAGIGVMLYVLFKDRMSPVQKIVLDLLNQLKSSLNTKTPTVVVPQPEFIVPSDLPLVKPSPIIVDTAKSQEDTFFQLVASWKKTRDLAASSKCSEAVEILDNAFQYLSPNVCNKTENQ